MLYYIGRFLFFVLFKSLFRLQVYGKDNIPKNRGFIIASNHESNLDPILAGVACPREISFMAKEELFRNKFFGFILRRVHAFAVKRGGTDPSSIKEAIRRLKNGRGLLLFPQGGRRDDVDIEDAKAGIGFLAQKAGVPIVPAFIEGSSKAMPKGTKFPRRAKISVYFGQPIVPKESQAYIEIAKEVMLSINCLQRHR